MFQQNNNSMSSIIGSDLKLNGDIDIKGDLLIYGTVNGNIKCIIYLQRLNPQIFFMLYIGQRRSYVR